MPSPGIGAAQRQHMQAVALAGGRGELVARLCIGDLHQLDVAHLEHDGVLGAAGRDGLALRVAAGVVGALGQHKTEVDKQVAGGAEVGDDKADVIEVDGLCRVILFLHTICPC